MSGCLVSRRKWSITYQLRKHTPPQALPGPTPSWPPLNTTRLGKSAAATRVQTPAARPTVGVQQVPTQDGTAAEPTTGSIRPSPRAGPRAAGPDTPSTVPATATAQRKELVKRVYVPAREALRWAASGPSGTWTGLATTASMLPGAAVPGIAARPCIATAGLSRARRQTATAERAQTRRHTSSTSLRSRPRTDPTVTCVSTNAATVLARSCSREEPRLP